MDLVIYGAQGYALGAYKALKTLYPRRKVRCFLVTEKGINSDTLDGIPVLEIASFAEKLTLKDKDNTEVLIATPENVQAEIEEILEKYGFQFHVRLDSMRFSMLSKLYHANLNRFLPLEALPVGCCKAPLRIYMAKSHKDRPLKNTVSIPGYVSPLQVGAANSDMRIADIADDIGDNISKKNVNYSELSGLYWIWKNVLDKEIEEEQYFGLMQYRRGFYFTEDEILRLESNDVDVVLPFPLPYEPDINAHHRRYLKEADWEAMLQALRELQPEYAEAFPAILSQEFMYNYNVILAKKDVLKSYCEWLFPILERTEELSVPKGKDRADRYIGYMGETLETLYFMKNKEKLNILHTVCQLAT